MRYPVVNLGARGGGGFPAMNPFAPAWIPQQPGPAQGRVLGQTPAPTAEALAAQQAWRAAKDVFDRVEKTYPKLVVTMGEDGAAEVWEQAKEKLAETEERLREVSA